MGEREVTERIEVPKQEQVYLCDFCGRSSEEFDGTFNEVYIEPTVDVDIHNQWFNRSYDGGDVVISGHFVEAEGVHLNCDERKHFCNECNAAHIEVHNDDNQ